MGIMDLFRAATDDKAAKVEDPSKDVDPNKTLSDSPPTAQKDGKMPGSGVNAENPLDSYAEMFKNAAKNTSAADAAPKFSLDPKVVGEVSSKLDFTQGVDPELMQKAMTGDAKAFMQVIQLATQNSYKAALEHGTALTDTFVSQRAEFDKKSINSSVRSNLTDAALSSTPNYNHPVIKAELTRVAKEFSAANPDATPQEIAETAKRYINDLASALTPASTTSSAKAGDMDWEAYLTK